MKAEELMVGDWICNTDWNTEEKVENILYKSVNTDCADDLLLDSILPIPITSEILEKNGFKKKDEDIYLFGGLNPSHSVTIFNSYRDYWWIDVRYGRVRTSIKYVHELQHALKLGKVKKEIEL